MLKDIQIISCIDNIISPYLLTTYSIIILSYQQSTVKCSKNEYPFHLSAFPLVSTGNLSCILDPTERVQGQVLSWKSKAVSKKAAAEKQCITLITQTLS